MSEIKWIKLTTDIFDDEKIRLIEAMPDADTLLIVWIKLLCLAGKINANGYIFLARDIPFNDDNLATLFGRPVNTIRLALRAFQQLQMITLDESGVIFLPNWEKHQNIIGLERIRENTRKRVTSFRERQKSITSEAVTLLKQNGNSEVTQQSRVDKSILNTNSIDKRKLAFSKTLIPFIDKYGKDGVREFCDYWTEPNKSNTKFKQETEKTWDTELRLKRWFKNDFNKPKKLDHKAIDQSNNSNLFK